MAGAAGARRRARGYALQVLYGLDLNDEPSVLSACEQGILARMLRERGIAGYFQHVCGLADVVQAGRLVRQQEGRLYP